MSASYHTQSTRGETNAQILDEFYRDMMNAADETERTMVWEKARASLQQLQQREIEEAVKNIEGMKNAKNCPSCKVQALIEKGDGTKCLNCRSEYPF